MRVRLTGSQQQTWIESTRGQAIEGVTGGHSTMVLDPGRINDISRLHHDEKAPVRRIVRELHMARKTIRKYLRSPAGCPGARKPRKSRLDPFKPTVRELVERDPEASAVVILDRLRPLGYEGQITTGVARECLFDNLPTAVAEHTGKIVRFNRQPREWIDQTANVRIHSETRERPLDRFGPDALRPQPQLEPDYRDTATARVHKDIRLRFDGNRYYAGLRTMPSKATSVAAVVRLSSSQSS